MMTKPGMIITGGTGFLGARLTEICSEKFTVYSISRRAHQKPNLPHGPDIHYFDADVGNFEALRAAFERIRELGGATILLHLAGYYDFTGEDHPEYTTTNVIGTRNVLELAVPLRLKRLFFTSSIAACPFPPPGGAVTEETPPTAPPPYSRSKRAGEELLQRYRDQVPSCILRLAAIFSEWCEYEPLYNFLETWLGGGWNARILGGCGKWAVPYLHVRDLVAFFLTVIEKCDQTQPQQVLQASPNGCTTVRELYERATLHHFGAPRRWIYVPKPLARLGIGMRERWGRLTGVMPFERSWMGEYIDMKLNVDATYTHRRLGWRPSPELSILNCIPAMIHNRRAHFAEWCRRYERSRKGGHRNPKLRCNPVLC